MWHTICLYRESLSAPDRLEGNVTHLCKSTQTLCQRPAFLARLVGVMLTIKLAGGPGVNCHDVSDVPQAEPALDIHLLWQGWNGKVASAFAPGAKPANTMSTLMAVAAAAPLAQMLNRTLAPVSDDLLER